VRQHGDLEFLAAGERAYSLDLLLLEFVELVYAENPRAQTALMFVALVLPPCWTR
jgi:hypothetical protein